NRGAYPLFNFEDFGRFLGFGWVGFSLDSDSRQARYIGPLLAWKNLRGIDTRGRHGWTVNGSVRKELPAAVPFCIHPFKPDRRKTSRNVGVSIFRHEQADVPSVSDSNVAVHFDLDVVKVVNKIFSFGDPFEEGSFVVLYPSGLLAP